MKPLQHLETGLETHSSLEVSILMRLFLFTQKHFALPSYRGMGKYSRLSKQSFVVMQFNLRIEENRHTEL